MLDQAPENYFTASSGGSSSYFDFVEKKIDNEKPDYADKATDTAPMSKDAFEVQVMDEETTNQMKLQYFDGYTNLK